MQQVLKSMLKRTWIYHPLRNWLLKQRQAKELRIWEMQGRPSPVPHIIKQRVLKEYAEKYDLTILVETGTYYGDMVEAMKDSFEKIFSIELSEHLFEMAKRRFANMEQVEIIEGDSGVELGNVLKRIHRPALFWFDAHYSAGVTTRGDKDSPIYDELHHILHAPDLGHVVIIDDARCFGSDPEYPSVDDLKKYIFSMRSNVCVTVEDDSIRVIPN